MTRPRSTYSVGDSWIDTEGPFVCCACGNTVEPSPSGGRHRNHCPHCLWSRHLDVHPGDRRCVCRGAMAPIAIWFRDDGEGALIHRCSRCGQLGSNRLAADDNPEALHSLVGRVAEAFAPVARPGDHHDTAK